MSDRRSEFREHIEWGAEKLGMSPSTLCRKAGQGGHFYRRLCDGKGFLTDTEDKVREFIDREVVEGAKDERR